MNLFVARLNPSTTTKDLQKLFAHYGLVTTVKVIFDRFTGKSKGYGFIEMPNNYEAHEALQELDKTLFQENLILVKESLPADNRNSTDNSEFRNGNIKSPLSGNITNQGNNRNFTSKIKSQQRTDNSLRNYGYRGSSYQTFR